MNTVGLKVTNVLREVSQNKKLVVALKIAAVVFLAFLATVSFSDVVMAETDIELDSAVHPVLTLINRLINPLLAIVGAGGVIFCIVMGVKYATAEEPQARADG